MKRTLIGVSALAATALTTTVAAAQAAPSLILFDQPSFAGHALRLDRGVGDLSSQEFNDTARSVVAEGRWELCVDANYKGGCRVVQGRVDDMADWSRKVTSARYVGPADWGAAAQGSAAAATPPVDAAKASGPTYVLDYEPEVIGNVYDSDFGAMTLERWDFAGAAGRYAGDGSPPGRFDGVRAAGNTSEHGVDTIRGYWYQETAAQRCPTARNGTNYWGQIQFNFDRGRNTYLGFWSHCDGTPLDRWNGAFVHRDPTIAAAVDAQLAARPQAQAKTQPSPQVGTAPYPAVGAAPPKPATPLPGAIDRTARTVGDELERRAQDRIREGIGKLF